MLHVVVLLTHACQRHQHAAVNKRQYTDTKGYSTGQELPDRLLGNAVFT